MFVMLILVKKYRALVMANQSHACSSNLNQIVLDHFPDLPPGSGEPSLTTAASENAKKHADAHGL